MRILPVSDLHLDWGLRPEERPTESCDVLVVAGDFRTSKRSEWNKDFTPTTYDRFEEFCRSVDAKHKMGVFGNHEYYEGVFPDEEKEIVSALEKRSPGAPAIEFHQKKTVIIDGVRFLLCTLWSDTTFAIGTCWGELRQFSDYRWIREPERKRVLPDTLLRAHREHLSWLVGQLAQKHDGPTVVVTHHVPTFQAEPERKRGDSLESCFYNNLDRMILETQPDLWIFGHSHDAWQGTIGKTRLVCNPRGYPGQESGFNPNLIVEV